MKQVNPRNLRPDPIPLTQDAFNRLKAEKERYLKEQDELLIRIQIAREMGDLSENGAYKYGKFELAKVRRELRRINYLLRWGVVKKASQNRIVDFGVWVTVKTDDATKKFLMVSEHESNPIENKLATTSPLGKALMGKSIGDVIKLETQIGTVTYQILEIISE